MYAGLLIGVRIPTLPEHMKQIAGIKPCQPHLTTKGINMSKKKKVQCGNWMDADVKKAFEDKVNAGKDDGIYSPGTSYSWIVECLVKKFTSGEVKVP